MVRLFYTDIESSILVNDYTTKPFKPSRGVRQGCPLSPLLYILTMEVLAVTIRSNSDIIGLSIPNTVSLPVLSLYADDTSVVVSTDRAITAVFETYDKFEKASGSKINLEKCEGLWLGSWQHRLDAPVAIRWTSHKIKVLGVYIGNGNLGESNWRLRIDAVKKCISSWRSLSLSFKGKALVLNALALSRIWYVASLIYMPHWVLAELNTLSYKFFWSGKRDLVARAVVYQPTDHGGFSVVNVDFKTSALLVQWVKRFVSSPSAWISLLTFWYFDRFGVSPLVVFSSPFLYDPSVLPSFHRSLLLAWREVGGFFSNPSNSLSISSHSGASPLIGSLTCKFVYQYILSLKVCPPHCVAKFLPSYGTLYWSSTWKQLFLMPLDRKVIDLNWKVCHGVLYTAARLSSFGYNHSTICFCGFHMETSEHLFFSCPLACSGIDWIQSLLFGFSPDEMRCIPRVLVYLLLVCKYLIWIQHNDHRFRSVRPSAVNLISSIRARVKFYLPLLFKRFHSARRRRYFIRQWGGNGTICSLVNSAPVISPLL